MPKSKLDAKKLKEEFDALDDDDKKSILETLGVDNSDDVDFKKKVLDRLTKLEGDKKPEKSEGFFSRYFSL